MVNRLSFFEPRRPKLLQIGQTRHQSTPLYLYIQNIILVCNSGLLCAGLERENFVYIQVLIRGAAASLSSCNHLKKLEKPVCSLQIPNKLLLKWFLIVASVLSS